MVSDDFRRSYAQPGAKNMQLERVEVFTITNTAKGAIAYSKLTSKTIRGLTGLGRS